MMAVCMDAQAPTPAGSETPWWQSRWFADAVATAAGVVFLVLCMALPLVGPAAARGSGSPGAARAAHYPKNVAAFLTIWLFATLLTGSGIALWIRLYGFNRRDRRLWALGALGVILLGILVAFLTGALAI